MESSKAGVYAIINLVAGKLYVGSAAGSFDRRWKDHKRRLNSGRHQNLYLQRSWNKHGAKSFEFVVLKICKPTDCIKFEQKYIDRLKSANPKFGYNRSPTAGSILGLKHPAETRAKMAAAKLGVPMLPEIKLKIKIALTGKAKSETHKKNLWKNRNGWKHTEESKANISNGLKLTTKKFGWPAGKKHSKKTRAKLSAQRKGVPKSEEHKAKIKQAHLNRRLNNGKSI